LLRFARDLLLGAGFCALSAWFLWNGWFALSEPERWKTHKWTARKNLSADTTNWIVRAFGAQFLGLGGAMLAMIVWFFYELVRIVSGASRSG
jgi:hypothetical protein